jgi:hypothetical protein
MTQSPLDGLAPVEPATLDDVVSELEKLGERVEGLNQRVDHLRNTVAGNSLQKWLVIAILLAHVIHHW